jgi:transcriptional regulator with XRE-family HTH domain
MIKQLRESISGTGNSPISQAGFAKILNANRIQVVRWEKGTELPSKAMLQKMATKAKTREERMAFWREAIPEAEFLELKALLREEITSRVKAFPEAAVTAIPVFNREQARAAKRSFTSDLAAGHLHISAECFGAAGAPVGLIVQKGLRSPLDKFPPPIAANDLVIVDRVLIDPAEILKKKATIALWLPRTPEVIGTEDEIRQILREEPSAYEYVDEPAIIFGSLEEQRAGSSAREIYIAPPGESPADANLWRLIFKSATGLIMPLTRWVIGRRPVDLREPFLNGCFIAGAVIGWMSESRLIKAPPDREPRS